MTMKWWWSTVLMVSIAGCSGGADGPDALAVMEGEAIYRAECATCHGNKLEGQPEWRTPRPDGKLPAPPHDATGHTWHHPMELLLAITKLGMVPPHAPQGYVSDMPALGGKLSDRQIQRVLLYIESQWPPDIRAQRIERFGK
ncbi:MAG: c-type cytochrome, partial [Gammaproteobacteria bacterium]|nr:c-type cytochrome [Gammaproteobacteria bacterium]